MKHIKVYQWLLLLFINYLLCMISYAQDCPPDIQDCSICFEKMDRSKIFENLVCGLFCLHKP